ncbi:hypothetical protein PFISCL1PPCAC_16421, partial [Pristionchus fissidentatus]
RSTRLLVSIIVVLLAQYGFADELGEISDDDFDPPPLMNTNATIGEKKETVAAAPPKIEEKEKTVSGVVDKLAKMKGNVHGDKTVTKPSFSATIDGKKIGVSAARNNSTEAADDEKDAKLSSAEKIVNSDKTKNAKNGVKVNPSSTEKEAMEKPKKEGSDKVKIEEKTTEVAAAGDDTTTVSPTTVDTKITVAEDSGENKQEMVDGEGEDKSEEPEEPEGEKVKTEKEKEKKKEEEKEEKRKKEETKKEEREKGGRPYPKQPLNVEYYSDSHFFSYFIFFIVISAGGYLAYHNKRKIMALMIEGRSGKGGRVRYHRLANDDNFERNVIY